MLDVIDLMGLDAAHGTTVRRVATELGRACRELGFFYVRNHGVPCALLTGIFGCAQSFFAAPPVDKSELAITRSRHNRGYVGMATESLNRSQTDLKEAFNIGLDLPDTDVDVLQGKPFRGVNLWPRTPGCRETVLAYYKHAMAARPRFTSGNRR
jgi:isopenicillin N synthase-like dioxygenase